MSAPERRMAVVLVDLQHDFLERPGVVPDPDTLCARVARLLDAARRRGVPVVHVQTVTRADGADAMPHWKRLGRLACVEGTRGALPPPALMPVDGELVVRKRFFSAFADARLDPWLRERGVSRVLVAGVYLHGCVRSTVLDAYERGYEVAVVDDAVGTTEPLHSEITRAYLVERAAAFVRMDDALAELGEPAAESSDASRRLPVAVINLAPRRTGTGPSVLHRNPCRSADVLSQVPLAGEAEIDAAAEACEAARGPWANADPSVRADLLERWAQDLAAHRNRLTDLVVREVAKPRRAAEEEVGRAVAHVRIAAELVRDAAQSSCPIAAGVAARQRPVGIVGLITPWNNPLAIPIGKIAPALGFGNAVVLKPAPEASATALALLESLQRAGLPAGLVNVVLGDGMTARAVCRAPRIAAISVTGSIATGRVVAGICALGMKPLQAELGGNNAAIVLRDADLERAAHGLARAAFAFAGQRCTAIRRIVVEASVRDRFEQLLRDAVVGLVNGEPSDPATEVGPLISTEKRDRVIATIERAVADGGRVIVGGHVPRGLEHGAWLEPALLTAVAPHGRIAQDETFAPVAVILPARDLDDALTIANGVPHGLVMSVHTRDEQARARVLEAAEAGILQLGSGPLAVHPSAPFSGWKASGLGPPEHGIWDAAFYARAQAVYTDEPC